MYQLIPRYLSSKSLSTQCSAECSPANIKHKKLSMLTTVNPPVVPIVAVVVIRYDRKEWFCSFVNDSIVNMANLFIHRITSYDQSDGPRHSSLLSRHVARLKVLDHISNTASMSVVGILIGNFTNSQVYWAQNQGFSLGSITQYDMPSTVKREST